MTQATSQLAARDLEREMGGTLVTIAKDVNTVTIITMISVTA